MKILGIETSCDETAAAIVEDGVRVLSNVIASQIDLHAKTGGVVPEVAAREHILKILPVVDEALKEARVDWDSIDAIAAVNEPGLVSALLTGFVTARTLAEVKGKPLIPINHIYAHIYGNWCERKASDFEFPILVLTVSGGHNELILMKNHGDFEVVGESRDDSAGEAFDKVAKLLGLGYPGGPAIQKTALEGNDLAFALPIAKMDGLDFSFSGLKTAVLYEIQRTYGRDFDPATLDAEFVANMAASFQKTVVETLVEKLAIAADKHGPKQIHLAGGVSANKLLREEAEKRLGEIKFPSKLSYCTDNAAMVASYGFFKG
ncbi:tRNA (adenosine(37)-N6)-threonylcarbamoyltransferase complex transferase subunit TsaD [Patescibacteria group bacterium]